MATTLEAATTATAATLLERFLRVPRGDVVLEVELAPFAGRAKLQQRGQIGNSRGGVGGITTKRLGACGFVGFGVYPSADIRQPY